MQSNSDGEKKKSRKKKDSKRSQSESADRSTLDTESLKKPNKLNKKKKKVYNDPEQLESRLHDLKGSVQIIVPDESFKDAQKMSYIQDANRKKSIDGILIEVQDKATSSFTFVLGCYFFKTLFGPMIIAMPIAFFNGGLIFSFFGFTVMLVLVRSNVKRLLYCANFLSKSEDVPVKTFDDVGFLCCYRSPHMRSRANSFKLFINLLFFFGYLIGFMTSITFLAVNISFIIKYFYPHSFAGLDYSFVFQIPIIMALCSVRNIKYIAPFSFAACAILVVEIILNILYLILYGLPPVVERRYIGSPETIMRFFSSIMFGMSGLTMTLSLRSSLSKPERFFISGGLYDWCLLVYALSFLSFGFMGYLRFGERTNLSIFVMPAETDFLTLIIKLLSFASVFLTTPLIFEVSFSALWNNYLVKRCHTSNELWIEFFARYFLVSIMYLLTSIYPNLYVLVVLKGAFFQGTLLLILPAVINYITFYPEKGKGKHKVRVLRLIFYVILGALVAIFGMAEVLKNKLY